METTATTTLPTTTILAVNNGHYRTSSTEFTHSGHQAMLWLCVEPSEQLTSSYFEVAIELEQGVWTEFNPLDFLEGPEEHAFWVMESLHNEFLEFGEKYTPEFCRLVALACDRALAAELTGMEPAKQPSEAERELLLNGIDPDDYQAAVDNEADMRRGN